ncbi:hypothetical protein ANN_11546 [Periplaneta americana]|uniref:Uncharacterized protein n=1 Tax=Periplaneta americana TaxID=6978 RepID=A0ABQ8T5B6_PERAM|nr:hypothetical protein ANN_11546 [Periplaneta americana]
MSTGSSPHGGRFSHENVKLHEFTLMCSSGDLRVYQEGQRMEGAVIVSWGLIYVKQFVLRGCETWTLTLREEQRLRVFENKVIRKIFGAERDEVTGEWRKLHNAELHALFSSPDIIRNIKSRRLRWAEHVARMGESRNAYRVLVGRPEGKRPLKRPRRRWEDNIKMDLREVGSLLERPTVVHVSGSGLVRIVLERFFCTAHAHDGYGRFLTAVGTNLMFPVLTAWGSSPGAYQERWQCKLLFAKVCTNIPGLNPKSLRSAYEQKAYVTVDNDSSNGWGRGRRRNPVREAAISEAMTRSPTKSLRRLSTEMNVPYTSCQGIVRKYLKLYPFHLQRLQALRDEDHEASFNFASMVCQRIEDDDGFLNKWR